MADGLNSKRCSMPETPVDASVDGTLALVREGYAFITNRCRRYQTDIFRTRLLFQKTICMMGEDAARVFYDTTRFERKGAMPLRVQKTLLGQGGVQTVDDDVHRSRKQMFMSLMTPRGIDRLAALMAIHWQSYLPRWERMNRVELFYEVNEILCRAVCAWASVPLEEVEVTKRTADFMRMIDGSGGLGPRHWRGRFARKSGEKWIGRFLERVRAGRLDVPEGSAVHTIAWHRDPDGALLDIEIAAVELLNVLRPTVAIARYIVFIAHALHEHPEYRQKLLDREEDYLELIVQEVRRFYPFFPLVAARVRKTFEWSGYQFPKGTRVLLDLYGTNHDARIWEDPEVFRPERFRQWNGSAFNFIPQGGGDHYENHRCPGEWITIALMKMALNLLTRSMRYDVPKQNLQITLARMPAIPESRFVISNVRAVQLSP